MTEIPLVPLHWRFPAHAASVRRARHAVVEALPMDVRPHLGSDMGLLTSELVTNAVRYGIGTREEAHEHVVELVLWPAGGHYWLAVSDPGTGTRTPTVGCPGSDSEGGRGLLLVEHMAAAWAVRPRPVSGTSVVAGLAVPREE